VGDDHKLVCPGSECQGDGAVAGISFFLRYRFDFSAVSVEEGYIQATAQFRDVGSGTGKGRLLELRHVQDDVCLLHRHNVLVEDRLLTRC